MDPELLSFDRLPLPSLKVYTVFSILAAFSSVYYVWTESDTAFKELAEQGRIGKNCNFKSLTSSFIQKLSDSEIVDVNKSFNDDTSFTRISTGLETISRYLVSDMWGAAGNTWETGEVKNQTDSKCSGEVGYHQLTWQLLQWASEQPHCVWPLVNLAYCILILLSHSIQKSVFGNLRSSEQENIKDQFWNLVFYKVVFVFGVVNVQEVEDAIGWCFFVSVIGFLQVARQLCKERHNYLIMMNDASKSSEARRRRIFSLLVFIFLASIFLFLAVVAWFMNSTSKDITHDFLDFSTIIPFVKPFDSEPIVASVGYDFNLGLHSAVFMLSEIGLLIIQTFHALTMCIFDRIYFNNKASIWSPINIFKMSSLCSESDEEDLYQCISQDINYKFEITTLLFDLVHHVHMLICCNLFLSMTSLIVSLQMRMRVRQIHSVLKRRQSFTWLNEHIDRYSDAKADESEPIYNDNCAICWESVASQKSKILPCHHIFHKTCLRKWLLVSMHCPTCRLSLLTEKEAQLRRDREPRRFNPRPAVGIIGLLQTGQTLLDLFGGYDPVGPDDYNNEGAVSNVPIFTDYSVQDWPVQVPTASTSQGQNQQEATQEGLSTSNKD